MTTRSTLPALAAAVGLHIFLTMRPDVALIAAPVMVKSDQPMRADGFDDECNAATPLWASVRTKVLCVSPAVMPVNAPVQRSAQTASCGSIVDGKDTVPRPEWAMLVGDQWPEVPLGVTDGLQPKVVGQSRRLYQRRKRHRRRVIGVSDSDDDERAPGIVGAMSGLWAGLVLVHPPAAWATWAFVTAVTGVWMLATDRHFWLPVCTALSLNYWCAAAWIGCAVSPEVGAAVAALAAAMRGSALLFPGADYIQFRVECVGAGMCCVLPCANGQDPCYLVDCGSADALNVRKDTIATRTAQVVAESLESSRKRQVVFIISHCHADHFNMLPKVVSIIHNRLTRVRFFVHAMGRHDGYPDWLQRCDALKAKIGTNNLLRICLKRNESGDINMPDSVAERESAAVSLYLPSTIAVEGDQKNGGCQTVVARMSQDGVSFKAVLPADAKLETTAHLVERHGDAVADATVTLMCHHGDEGAHSGNTSSWVAKVNPKIVLANAGTKNWHPRLAAIRTYLEARSLSEGEVPHAISFWAEKGDTKDNLQLGDHVTDLADTTEKSGGRWRAVGKTAREIYNTHDFDPCITVKMSKDTLAVYVE